MVNEHNFSHSISWDTQSEKCKKQEYIMHKILTFRIEHTQLAKLSG
jgi:hypothetical protein